jgi:hypothetical protein
MKRASLVIALVLFPLVLSGPAVAAPVISQIVPVAVYQDSVSPFGLAYDSQHNLIWFSRGDSGDANLHSLRPFKDFTAAEIAALPVNGDGARVISPAVGLRDVAGTTTTGLSNFKSLGFDSVSNQLVIQGAGVNLVSFDPITALNRNDNYRPGTAVSSFTDGLDVDGGTVWHSPDAGDIFKNGVLFASTGNAAQLLSIAGGAIADQGLGWSGAEEVNTGSLDELFAVAVFTNADTGRSRTIVSFDPNTGALLRFDPDGDPVAARWEDLAFDGRYLYAADLRGNENDNEFIGDIYVFDITGPGGSIFVPEPASLVLLGAGLIGLVAWRMRRED